MGLHAEKSATIHRGVTCYEGGGEKSCISIGGDHGRSVVGALDLELGPSGRRDFRVVDLGEVQVSKMVECYYRFRVSLGLRVASRWTRVAEAPGWSVRVINL